jgi:hypothetical protein
MTGSAEFCAIAATRPCSEAPPPRRAPVGHWRCERRSRAFERGRILLRAIAGIGRDLLWGRREVSRNLFGRRNQIRAIARLVADCLGDDDLCRGVDRGLRVEALDEAVLGLYDQALRIGEVVLRPRLDGGQALAGGGSVPRPRT